MSHYIVMFLLSTKYSMLLGILLIVCAVLYIIRCRIHADYRGGAAAAFGIFVALTSAGLYYLNLSLGWLDHEQNRLLLRLWTTVLCLTLLSNHFYALWMYRRIKISSVPDETLSVLSEEQ